MAYDAARGVTVLFGGEGLAWDDPPIGDTWLWDGNVWQQANGTGPPGRTGHAMAFDGARGVVVMYGGYDNENLFTDTWEWDGSAWSERLVAGPGIRSGHAMAYDRDRSVTMLYAGYDGGLGGESTETWEWDGSAWTLAGTNGPAFSGVSRAMYFDSVRGRVRVYGGEQGPHTWEWDGASWTQGDDTQGPDGAVYAIAFDEARGRAVMVNDHCYCETDGQTWELEGNTWIPRVTPGMPRLFGPTSAYDTARSVTVAVGSYFDDSTWPPVDQTWEWDGQNWILRASNSGLPAPDENFDGMVYDSVRGVCVLFESSPSGNQLWEWDGQNWTQRVEPGLSPRSGAAVAFDDWRGLTLVVGGLGCSTNRSSCTNHTDIWGWDGTSWTLLDDDGPGRSLAGLTFDPMRGTAVLFGGYPDGAATCPTAETWEWDGATWAFRTDNEPFVRSTPGMIYDSHRGVVVRFGGTECDVGQTDLWEWNGADWTRLQAAGPDWNNAPAWSYDSARRVGVLVQSSDSFSEILELTDDTACPAPPVRPHAERYRNCAGECYAAKNRYLSFVAPPAPGCGTSAIALRITLSDMPAAGQCPGLPDLSGFEGVQMWLGTETAEGVFSLQAAPLFADWTHVPGRIIHVSDCNIVPCATYTIEAITESDYPGGPYSVPLVLTTVARWGDVIGWNNSEPADGVCNVLDLSAVVDCVKGIPGAAPLTWCDLFGAESPSGGGDGAANVLDIATEVDALKGLAYTLPLPTAPSACTIP